MGGITHASWKGGECAPDPEGNTFVFFLGETSQEVQRVRQSRGGTGVAWSDPGGGEFGFCSAFVLFGRARCRLEPMSSVHWEARRSEQTISGHSGVMERGVLGVEVWWARPSAGRPRAPEAVQ